MVAVDEGVKGNAVANAGDAGEFVGAICRGLCFFGDTAHVVFVKVGEPSIIDVGIGAHLGDVVGNPVVGWFGIVGTGGGIARGTHAFGGGVEFPCIYEHGCAVGQSVKGAVATTCVDMVQV